MDAILGYVEKLDELDTEDRAPETDDDTPEDDEK